MKRLLLSLALISVTAFGDTGWLFQPLYTQGTNNPQNTATAGNKGSLYFNNNNNSVFIKLDDFVTTNWAAINGGNGTNTFFARTCSITSAAAGTYVPCLAVADVPTAQSAHLIGFHGSVNGSTAWGTTVSCSVEDTTGTPIVFASVATSAMTGSAYITPSTSGVTLDTPFTLNTGGGAGQGVGIICNAVGTGSTFVLTIEGYLH